MPRRAGFLSLLTTLFEPMTRTLSSLLSVAALVLLAGFVWAGPNTPADPPKADAASDGAVAEVVAWNVDKAHSAVSFSVRHLAISRVRGAFHDYTASVEMDPNDISTLQTSATVQVQSIDTENTDRDDHLRSPDFFNAESYPEMRFESTGVSNVDGNTFTLTGDLTIKDVTQSVDFDAELIGTAVDPQGNQRAAFTAETTINRKEFGLSWNKLTEAGGVVVGEDVTITLDIQTIREDA